MHIGSRGPLQRLARPGSHRDHEPQRPFAIVRGAAAALILVVVAAGAPVNVPAAAAAAASGGPVILDGTDAGYHGGVSGDALSGQWTYIKKAYQNLLGAVPSSYASNSRIAVIGSPQAGSTSNPASSNCGAAAYHGARLQPGGAVAVDFYDGASAIEAFFGGLVAGVTRPKLIHIVDTICNTNRLTAPELAVINANGSAIATHVNRGGALFANTQDSPPSRTTAG